MSEEAASAAAVLPPLPSVSLRGYRAWIKDGYALFRKAPWLWLGGTLVLLVLSVPLHTASEYGLDFLRVTLSWMFGEDGRSRSVLLPLLSKTLVVMLSEAVVEEVILLGIMALYYGVADRLARHGAASWGDFFSLAAPGRTQQSGWRIAALALWTGMLNTLPFAFAMLVAFASIAGSIDRFLDSAPSFLSHPVVLIGGVVLLVLLAVRGILTLVMAQVFALQLLFGGCRPLQALRLSLRGCRDNTWNMVWHALAILVFSVIVVLPALGLGMLLMGPITVCSWYCAYQDIYRQDGCQV